MVAIYYEDPDSDRMIRTSATWIDSDYGVAAEILDEDWAKIKLPRRICNAKIKPFNPTSKKPFWNKSLIFNIDS